MDSAEMLPLSYLNQFAYCPRRFWLMYVYGEMEINAVVLDGIYKHGKAHNPAAHWHEDSRLYASVWVWSNKLGIAGIADFVQENPKGQLIPLEHKRGRMGQHLNDHIQLCAQAMCLEERSQESVEYGEIFYWKNRRREVVIFDEILRQNTRQTIEKIHASLADGKMPPPIDHPAKCRDCSLQPICLPQEVRLLQEIDL